MSDKSWCPENDGAYRDEVAAIERESISQLKSRITALETDIARVKKENERCICSINWRDIVNEVQAYIDRDFICSRTNKVYTFFGVVWGSDDFYYGMYRVGDPVMLLSCVGNLEGHGYELIDADWDENDGNE